MVDSALLFSYDAPFFYTFSTSRAAARRLLVFQRKGRTAMAFDEQPLRAANSPGETVPYLRDLFREERYDDLGNAMIFFRDQVAEINRNLSYRYLAKRIPAFVNNYLTTVKLPEEHWIGWDAEFGEMVGELLEERAQGDMWWAAFQLRFKDEGHGLGLTDFFVHGLVDHARPLSDLLEVVLASYPAYCEKHGV
jgi:hypothetical protein